MPALDRRSSLKTRRRRLWLWVFAGVFLVGLAGYSAPPSAADDGGTVSATAVTAQVHGQEAVAAGESAQEDSTGHTTARFLLILVAILMAGKLGGEFAERVGQPAVLGELIAGVIVGHRVL